MASETSIKRGSTQLPAPQFWGLVVVMYMVLQFPLVRIPVLFISTWAHELGHGMGAMMTGGEFRSLTVFADFSGVALTATRSSFSQGMVVIVGLLGPSLLGVWMIMLTRAFGLYRLALLSLAALMALSLIWAGDRFTFLTLGIAAAIISVMGWKVPDRAVLYIAYCLAISLCLSALTGFGYFFMGNAEVAGDFYRSDTGVLSDIWGGPYWLWGGIMVCLSVIILLAGVILSDAWARRRGRQVG